MDKLNLTSIAITSANNGIKTWKAIEKGIYKIVYTSPEVLMENGSYFWKRILLGDSIFMKYLSCVAIDEAHVLYTWNQFRSAYKGIGRLRDCLPQIPFVLLSATLPPNVLQYVIRTARLKNSSHIKHTVDRSNLQIVVSKITSGGYDDLKGLISSDAGPEYTIPSTLIFVDSRKKCVSIARFLRRCLPAHLKKRSRVLVRVYNAFYEQEIRDVYMEDLRKGVTCILVCTDACGMGVDLRTIERVVQWDINEGLQMVSLTQRIGRAGRDPNIKALAIVFAPPDCFVPAGESPAAVEANSEDTENQPRKRRKTTKDPVQASATSSEEGEDGTGDSVYDNIHIPVGQDNLPEVDKLLRAIYSRTAQPPGKTKNSRFKRGWKNLDPALLWFLNTSGCRHRVILAYLGDPAFKESRSLCCDICIMEEISSVDSLVPSQFELPTQYPISRTVAYEAMNRLGNPMDQQKFYHGIPEQGPAVTSAPPTKLNKPRTDQMRQSIQDWRLETWNSLHGRDFVRQTTFLSNSAIDLLSANAHKITDEETLQQILLRAGYQAPQCLLFRHTCSLLQTILSTKAATVSLQPPRQRKSAPAKRPPLTDVSNVKRNRVKRQLFVELP